MNYKDKYLKYKMKYLNLKNQSGGFQSYKFHPANILSNDPNPLNVLSSPGFSYQPQSIDKTTLTKKTIGNFNAFSTPSGLPIDSVFGDHSTIKVTLPGYPKSLLFLTGAELLNKRKGFKHLAGGSNLFEGVDMDRINKLDQTLKITCVELINNYVGKLFYNPLPDVSGLFKLEKSKVFFKFKPDELKSSSDLKSSIKLFFTTTQNKFKEIIQSVIDLEYTDYDITRCAFERTPECIKKIKTRTLLETLIKNIDKNTIDNLMNFDTSPIFNDKNGMFKGPDTSKRSYYLLQIFGVLLNTQPFGGFNLTSDLGDIYSSNDKFLKEIRRLVDKYDLYGVDGIDEINTNLITKIKKNNTVHGNSSGEKDVFDDIANILKKTDSHFCFSDTNNTVKKSGIDINKNLDYHKEQLETSLRKQNVKGTFYLVMSKIQITKSRSGGPIFNTQIYKSEPNPVTERDGMIGVFKNIRPEIEPHLEMTQFTL